MNHALHRLSSLLLGLALVFGASNAQSAAKEGDLLPTISLTEVSTNTVKDVGTVLKGSVGALVYMQTSCAACRKELTALKELLVKFPTCKVAVISVDAGGPERVVKYKEHFGFEFPFFQDPEFKTPDLFGFSFTPALVLVDRDGKIAQLKGGFRPGDEAELEKRFSALIGK